MTTDTPITPPGRCSLPARDRVALQPGEHPVSAWLASTTVELAAYLSRRAGTPEGRPAIIAMDGRGGSGKSSLASALAAAVPGTRILHVDDLDWNEPLFAWDHLLVAALTEIHRTGALNLTPPAWPAHGRAGALVIPGGAPLVVVEGTGAGMRAVTDLIDLHVWVQTDDEVAEARGIARDTEEGANGDAEETVAFWHWWMDAERRFFAADRPWLRADVIVSGEALPGLGPGETAWVEGPLPA
ncbi:MAG: hypothetical protein Q4C85_05745 [Actinomyces sp.]|uniref:hypothetical protein n=1 Tax=Actinomyces sp. TaxID=29317 RepID=UPI0026DC50D9|nr:hypothetical protein [Actinomyces sp.]MDO4243254.1 hypothetical protein [Actinomyces sp.]